MSMDDYSESSRCYGRAIGIPGRSLTRSKAPGKLYAPGTAGPLYASHGDGAYLWDVDGHRFIDMICALGAVSLGYAFRYPGRQPARDTTVLSLPHRVEGEAAEAVLTHVAPWASSVRFVRTGSEAVHAAVMVARLATGRPHILVAGNSYHGWHEWASVRRGHETLEYQYGTVPVVRHDVAALIVEPARWEPTPDGYLSALAAAAHAAGSLFVIDEMIYGGRWALGGACAYFDVTPDLACYGKAYGNGAAVAFVAGRDALRDRGEVVSGTYSGDVSALSELLATLDTYLTLPVLPTLWERGDRLRVVLDAAISAHRAADVWCEGVGTVHQRLRFADPARGKAFAGEMARRGVLWHPDVANVCYAHTAAQIDAVGDAAAASLRAMR